MDLSRRSISLCAIWRSRLESSGCSSRLSSDVAAAFHRAASTKRLLKLPEFKVFRNHPNLSFSFAILYYKAWLFFLFSLAEYFCSFRPSLPRLLLRCS